MSRPSFFAVEPVPVPTDEQALRDQVRLATIAECQLALRDSAGILQRTLPGESSAKVAWAYRVSADLLEGLRA
jgi:hypothetical protein